MGFDSRGIRGHSCSRPEGLLFLPELHFGDLMHIYGTPHASLFVGLLEPTENNPFWDKS